MKAPARRRCHHSVHIVHTVLDWIVQTRHIGIGLHEQIPTVPIILNLVTRVDSGTPWPSLFLCSLVEVVHIPQKRSLDDQPSGAFVEPLHEAEYSGIPNPVIVVCT